MSLRNVVPIILEGEAERAQLEQDLEGMGCVGLLHQPQTIKNEELMHEFVMIQEKQSEQYNIFDTTMREWSKGLRIQGRSSSSCSSDSDGTGSAS